jgi:hypothetical protein
MTFGPKKLLNMAAIFIVMIIASVSIFTSDMLKPTRLELETFFEDELTNCEIIIVVEREYPGKGTYQLFGTNCNSKYYPIILDKVSDYKDYERFEKGMIVNKKANSVNLTLKKSTSELKLKIRHPSNEDERFFSIKIMLIFFGTIFVIMFFIPNSFWERKEINTEN